MFLVDASVWVAAKDADDRFFDAAQALVFDTRRPLASLDLTLHETANVVCGCWGQPDAAKELCRTIVARCGENILAADADLVASAVDIASEHGLTAYDAAYVAAARRHGWRLVSVDMADLVSKGLAIAPDSVDRH
jgi:predicted nucleic acid-binding protein